MRLLGVLLWIVTIAIGLTLLAVTLLPVPLTPAGLGGRTWLFFAFGVGVISFHLGLAMVVFTFCAAVLRRWKLVVIAAAVVVLALGGETWRALPRVAGVPDGPTLRVASLNVYYFNPDVAAMEAEIRRIDADVVALQEVRRHTEQQLLIRLTDLYPHHLAGRSNADSGRVLLSKHPMLSGSGSTRIDGRLRATLVVDGRLLDVSSVHHRSPAGRDTVARNAAQAADLVASLPDRADRPAIYFGDFNAHTTTPQMQALEKAGLREAHADAGGGRGTTWRSTRPNGRFRISGPLYALGLGVRIDHVLHTPDLVAADAGVGRSFGSDHRPIWADLVWPRR